MSVKTERVLKFYEGPLEDTGVFDEHKEGKLSVEIDGKIRPVTIGGKRLCLPNREVLDKSDWDNCIPFHPFSEQIDQGPSPVLNAFKNYIVERMKRTIKPISISLMELAADHTRHKSLNKDEAAFMSNLVGADEKTLDTLKAVLKATSDVPEKRLINLFLMNGGENNALRTCVVGFPILDDAKNEDTTTFFGIKMPRKTKDKQLIVNLLEYVLGGGDIQKKYTQASKDRSAPYFHSLLLSFAALAKQMNQLIDIHSKSCPDIAELKFKLEWLDEMEDFEDLARTGGVIPSLPGNRGKDTSSSEETSAYESDAKDL